MNVGSLGIYKSFIKKVIRDMEIQSDDQILDLGCGTGRNANLMRKYLSINGHITGFDISEHM
jgi:ubiquinone/menaquinone biosynthesis C-methylase UbiE